MMTIEDALAKWQDDTIRAQREELLRLYIELKEARELINELNEVIESLEAKQPEPDGSFEITPMGLALVTALDDFENGSQE